MRASRDRASARNTGQAPPTGARWEPTAPPPPWPWRRRAPSTWLRPQAHDPPCHAGDALRRTQRQTGGPVLELLRAARPRDPLVLALEVPRHGRLESLLVRARAPTEHALGLCGPVGPAVARRAHLGRRERPR